VWIPILQVANEIDIEARLPEVVEVSPEGEMIYRQRIVGEFSTRLDHRRLLRVARTASGGGSERGASTPQRT
jgi:hypothetical protein